MKERIRTTPNLALDSPIHMEAIKQGNENYSSWAFNVVDEFKSKTKEEIKDQLKNTSFPYAVCFEDWIGDFNKSSGIRNANAFNAREVFYLGDKRFDRRGCQGVYHYTDVQWIPTIDDFVKLKDNYKIVGIDNIPGSISLNTYIWQPNTLVVFGSEGTGLTPAMQSMCDEMVYIPQFGSVRSLNCGVASGIIMNDIVRQLESK